MLLFEEVCKTMHKRAVTKMQKDCRQSYKRKLTLPTKSIPIHGLFSRVLSLRCNPAARTSENTAVRNAWNQRPRPRLSRRQDLGMSVAMLRLQLAVVAERWQLSTVDAGSILSGVSTFAPWRIALTCSPPGTWRCSLCFQTQMFHSSKEGMARWPSGWLIPGWKMEPIK